MLIPQSSIEPFGYLGIPTLDNIKDLGDLLLKIATAIDEESHDTSNQLLTPRIMSIVLESVVMRLANKRLKWIEVNYHEGGEDGEVIFQIRFKLYDNASIRYIYCSYIPRDIPHFNEYP